jgi:hypothetical protein
MRLGFAVGVLAAVGYGLVLALDFPHGSRLFPLAIGIPTMILAAVEVGRQAVRRRRRAPGEVDPPAEGVPAVSRTPVAWTYALIAGAFLFGVEWVAPLFIFAYLKLMARWSIIKAVASAAAYYLVITTLSGALGLRIPPGWFSG